MPSHESSLETSKSQILESGPEFFNDLLSQIESAQTSIIIKAFLWRNDECGNKIADAIKKAADRGVSVMIIKDRMGAFYEYSEGKGQSFFHDHPEQSSRILDPNKLSTVHSQGRLMADFNGNEIEPLEDNPMRSDIVNHKNIEVIDDSKLYDHSKVIIIDREVAYVGGIGMGDDFYTPGDDLYIDYMMKMQDPEVCKELSKYLTNCFGERGQVGNIEFLGDDCLRQQGSSLHSAMIDFVDRTREKIQIEMGFLGNRDYIHALSNAAKRGADVFLTTSKKSNSNDKRNAHFLKTLQRMAGDSADKLHYSLHPRTVHSKVALRDDEILTMGSHNWSAPAGTFEETNLVTTDPTIIKQMQRHLEKHHEEGEQVVDMESWLKILPRSRPEWASMVVQKIMRQWRSKAIVSARYQCRQKFLDLSHKTHNESQRRASEDHLRERQKRLEAEAGE